MTKNFSDWLRYIKKDPSAEFVERRSKAIEEMADDVESYLNPEDLASLISANLLDSDETLEAFRAVFQKHDSSFLMVNNLAELRILGCLLLDCLLADTAKHDEDLDQIAMLVCSSLHLRTEERPYFELFDLTMNYLANRSTKIRGGHSSEKIGSSSLSKIKIAEITTKMPASPAEAAPLMEKALLAAQADLARLFHSQKKLLEESNVLWWLVNDFNESSNRPYVEMEWLEALLPTVKDFLSVLNFNIAPSSSVQIMNRILRTTKKSASGKCSIVDIVSKTDPEWARKFLLNSSVMDAVKSTPWLFPITNTLRTRCEIEDSAIWQKQGEAQSGVKLATKLNRAQLINQILLEFNALSISGHFDV